eukprot:1098312-Rhodomonas_salina.1
MRAVLDNVYALVRWANSHGHNMILSGDLNATLKDEHQINYADSISLLPVDLLRDCFSSTGVSVVSGSDVMTWKSKVGQQQAVLDHLWFWPPSLHKVGSGVEWRKDLCFDHAIRWAEFDGNDVGFGTVHDTTSTPFLLKLKLTLWKDQKEEVLEKGAMLKETDPLLESLEMLSQELQNSLWDQLSQSLSDFKHTATEVSGETKEPTGRAPMKLPGH